MGEALIRVKDLCKIYNPGENEVRHWIILIWKSIKVNLLRSSDSRDLENLHL